MNDRDLLEVIAREAPQPGPDQTGTVLRKARRMRRRRRAGAVVAGAIGTAAVVTVATVALHGSGDGGHRTATTPPPSPTVQQRAASPQAAAYAAAIRGIAGDRPPRVLYVLDHTCANVITRQPGGCHPRPLPAALRTDLRQTLTGFAPITFIADGGSVTGPPGDGLIVRNNGAVITLGPATVREGSATVPLSVRRSGLDGRGLTYLLSHRHSGWTITGTRGSEWVS